MATNLLLLDIIFLRVLSCKWNKEFSNMKWLTDESIFKAAQFSCQKFVIIKLFRCRWSRIAFIRGSLNSALRSAFASYFRNFQLKWYFTSKRFFMTSNIFHLSTRNFPIFQLAKIAKICSIIRSASSALSIHDRSMLQAIDEWFEIFSQLWSVIREKFISAFIAHRFYSPKFNESNIPI